MTTRGTKLLDLTPDQLVQAYVSLFSSPGKVGHVVKSSLKNADGPTLLWAVLELTSVWNSTRESTSIIAVSAKLMFLRSL